MIKKIFFISLAFIFIINTEGFTISWDYCPMKKTTTFSFSSEESCCCKSSMRNNCCKKNKISFVKIKDNYTPSQVSKIPNSELSLFLLSFVNSLLSPALGNNKNDFIVTDHKPPDKSVSLIILNRAILI